MTIGNEEGVLAFAHVGDTHVGDPDGQAFRDLLSVLVQLETQMRPGLDFVVLPGDCADHGLPEQYALIATALRMLSLPVHVIPGDHDMEGGGLADFHAGLRVPALPAALRLRGHRCLFLDVCGAGTGGPDFRLGAAQLDWIAAELAEANAAGETPLVFMHAFASDLSDPEEASRLTQLLQAHGVALVDTGHTHYNELANDGTTVFAATRSTGQVEEGPVGYGVVTLDGGVVGWRFRALADPFPFVAITTPADHRLRRERAMPDAPAPNAPALGGAAREVGARVFGAEPVAGVEFRRDGGPWTPMLRAANGLDWRAPLPEGDGAPFELTVRATTPAGRPGLHAIRVAGASPGADAPRGTGGGETPIGPWPDNGIPGTRLGPNALGRTW